MNGVGVQLPGFGLLVFDELIEVVILDGEGEGLHGVHDGEGEEFGSQEFTINGVDIEF